MASTNDLHAGKLFDLTGRVALVTGGGTGIGLMISQALSANGAKVYIGSRREDAVKRAADEHEVKGEGSLIPITLDVTDRESILAVADEMEKKEGRLDILVNNAGVDSNKVTFVSSDEAPHGGEDPKAFGRKLFDAETHEHWSDVFRTNVTAHYFVTAAFLGLLAAASEKRGNMSACVINVTSISGFIKISQSHFAYNASKAAANHITNMLSTEFANNKVPVRVNAIAPGVFPTEMTGKKSDERNKTDLDDKSKGLDKLPIGRSGNDEEMARTALYLATNTYVTGTTAIVDGGFIATTPSTI